MNKEKVFIEGYEVGFQIDTLRTREKIIQLVSGETVSIDENFIYKSIEQEKVTIPQFVADLLEFAKLNDWDLEDVFEDVRNEHSDTEISEWFYQKKNMDILARAWLDGYEVEKEKRYLVRIIGITDYNSYLNYHKEEDKWTIESRVEIDAIRTNHTRKELEEANFGWVFDCEGIEVEEVEE